LSSQHKDVPCHSVKVNVWCLSSQNRKPDQQLVVGHDKGEDRCDDLNGDEAMVEHGDGA
jgi:hypothetical protein